MHRLILSITSTPYIFDQSLAVFHIIKNLYHIKTKWKRENASISASVIEGLGLTTGIKCKYTSNEIIEITWRMHSFKVTFGQGRNL